MDTCTIQVCSKTLLTLDSTLNVIYQFNMTTNATVTFAGTAGSSGYSGDFGSATSAQIYSPRGMHVSPNGIVYFAGMLLMYYVTS